MARIRPRDGSPSLLQAPGGDGCKASLESFVRAFDYRHRWCVRLTLTRLFSVVRRLLSQLSAPAHRAPEAPRLQSDLGKGQGGVRNDRATGGVLPDQVPALATRYSSLAVPVAALRSSAGSALRGAPLFPTGPPSIVS